MAIASHSLTSGSDGTNGTSYATASVTVDANRIAFVLVYNSSFDVDAADPSSITGAGRTWAMVTSVATDTSFSKLSLWRSTGSGGSGALTITFATDRTCCEWAVFEVSSTLNLTNNGADTLGTAVTNSNNNSTTITATMGAFADANSGAIAIFGHDNGSSTTVRTATVDTGWTELYDFGLASGSFSQSVQVQFIASNDTSAGATWSAADAATYNGIIAVEVKGASSLTTAAFSGSGAATVTGTGASLVKASGSITSTATATGSARTTNAAAGSITSTATATGSGRATAAAAFDSDAAAAATGVGVSTVAAAFDSDAVATVTGYPATVILSEAAGAISISAAATAYGAASASAGGYCEVECEVLGVSESEAITVRVQEGRRPKKREDDAEEISELLLAVMPQIWSHYV